MNKEIYYSQREFLNKGQKFPALILSQVASYLDGSYISSDNEFKISDCHRTISLDIDCEDNEKYQDVVDKLKLIEEVIFLTLKALSLQRMEMTQVQEKIKSKDKLTDKT